MQPFSFSVWFFLSEIHSINVLSFNKFRMQHTFKYFFPFFAKRDSVCVTTLCLAIKISCHIFYLSFWLKFRHSWLFIFLYTLNFVIKCHLTFLFKKLAHLAIFPPHICIYLAAWTTTLSTIVAFEKLITAHRFCVDLGIFQHFPVCLMLCLKTSLSLVLKFFMAHKWRTS